MTERDVAVVGFAQRRMCAAPTAPPTASSCWCPASPSVRADSASRRRDIGFWCSGSSDYLAGRSFSFVSAVDAIGAVPPVNESHVEMDAAWALYEAWIKILTGEVDTALVYGFGKSSAGVLRRVLALQLDPYTVTPLWPDTVSLAGLQARLGLDAGMWTDEQMAQVALDSFAAAQRTDSGEAGQEHRRAARPAVFRRPAAPPRLRADHRRRGGDRARRRRPGPRAAREPGLDHRLRAPHRPRCWAPAT